MCSNCDGSYPAGRSIAPCIGAHRYVWDHKREFRFCESCFIEEPKTLLATNKELGGAPCEGNGSRLLAESPSTITDGLGRDALDVLLENAALRLNTLRASRDDKALAASNAAMKKILTSQP